jgi:ADP-ribose pyrophosphatase
MDLSFSDPRVRHLVQNRWIDLREVVYTLPDGTVSPPYYTYSRKNYAVIVATDEAGRYLCVRQFRPGLGTVTTEFPAGGIDRRGEPFYGPDESNQEDPLAAAKRELEEETGYISDDWELLLRVPSQATMGDNWAYLFRARHCRRSGRQHLDDTEFLNVLALSPEELEERIRAGGFEQAVHVLAWALARRGG